PEQGAILVAVGQRQRRVGSEPIAAVLLGSVNQAERSIKAPPPVAIQGDAGPCFHNHWHAIVADTYPAAGASRFQLCCAHRHDSPHAASSYLRRGWLPGYAEGSSTATPCPLDSYTFRTHARSSSPAAPDISGSRASLILARNS